jgi:pyruvate dehydrogenase E1 component
MQIAEQTQSSDSDIDALERIERRVLWLAASIVHHANHVRTTPSGIKVGGHQASSASMVSIMTSLYFANLRAADRVSVKPHASPVLHAINYLLGRLEPRYLTELRAFHGLQSYPSRTKDPDPVDYSTGSVGIGATATIWSALAKRYVDDHGGVANNGRHIAIVGDAELDEGAIWEALVDPQVPRLGEVMWIVDLNRQSLDRVVPDIAAGRIGAMFAAAGWQTISVKYGRRLRELFDRPNGDALRHRIDTMSNEEFQRMLRLPSGDVRGRLTADPLTGSNLQRLLADLDDTEVAAAVRDLGGHDIADLIDAYDLADRTTDRPSVVFAYTIKARGLPTEGHPANHSALLSPEQWRALARDLSTDPERPWAPFENGTREAELCTIAARRLRRDDAMTTTTPAPSVPHELGRPHAPHGSTQQALGRFFVDLTHVDPAIAGRVVTVSPDVASSTNLGAWINRVGVWNTEDRADWFCDDAETLMKWREGAAGQHIELGIAEGNLAGLLGELGATWSRWGQPLLPIGTIYDPFVTRALEQWSFGMYAGGQSILVGTPSGITLAPEGGAHQSIITPSIGVEQPQCVGWEPCFAQDLEWTMLHALSRLGKADGTSAYFRLSTRPIDQSLAAMPTDDGLREQRRRQAVAGGYPIRRSTRLPNITLVGMGVVMPEVLAAASQLDAAGVAVDVACVTSANLVFRALQSRQGLSGGGYRILDVLFPASRRSPIVTVLDGHPHTLSFLAGVNGTLIANLGVDDFGQVGDIDDLYRHYGIDTATIVGAAWDLIEGPLDDIGAPDQPLNPA